MIAVIDYGAGNVRSVQNALKRLGVESVLTNDKSVIESAEKVIFPGVGEASFAMEQLRKLNLVDVIRQLKQPVLGICLGQQLMCLESEEGNTPCLGIFDVKVKAFPKTERVPHMGWNNLSLSSADILANIESKDDFYFVHSYYCEINENTIAESTYCVPFSAIMQKDNFYAMQFHPEKSGSVGAQLLQNFLTL